MKKNKHLKIYDISNNPLRKNCNKYNCNLELYLAISKKIINI